MPGQFIRLPLAMTGGLLYVQALLNMQAKPSEASQGFVSEITFIGVQAEKNE
jgi:hypothetical protein